VRKAIEETRLEHKLRARVAGVQVRASFLTKNEYMFKVSYLID